MQGSDLAVGGKLEGAMGQSTAQKVLGNKRKRGDSTSGLVESSDSVSLNEKCCIRKDIDLPWVESSDPNK